MAKPIGAVVLALAVAGGSGMGRAAPAECSGSRWVDLSFGCIDLPCGYRVVRTGGRNDFFLGYIEPAETNWRVLWSTALHGSVLEPSTKRHVAWVREESVAGRPMRVGRFAEKGAEFLVVRDGLAEFAIPADVPHGLGLLKALAGRYRGSSIGLDCGPAERAEDAKP